ncbi:MAG: leucine-rich repeat domain-containing protein [Chlamydiales bacterium]
MPESSKTIASVCKEWKNGVERATRYKCKLLSISDEAPMRLIIEFAATTALPRLNRAWKRHVNELLLQKWWINREPKELVIWKVKMLGTKPNDKPPNYFDPFRRLVYLLANHLNKLDPEVSPGGEKNTLQLVRKKFRSSLSPQRVEVMHRAIVKGNCLVAIWKQTREAAQVLQPTNNMSLITQQFCIKEYGSYFSRVRKIAISGMHLREVPIELVRFHELRSLDLSRNELTDVPGWVFNIFAKLEWCSISQNPIPLHNFGAIAERIADMRNACCFEISDPLFELTIRHKFARAKCFRKIWKDVLKNAFPDRLESFYKNAREKHILRASKICELLLDPKQKSVLSRIKKLDIHDAGLTLVPGEVFLGLTNLCEIDLSQNPLTDLPYYSMEKLQDLHTLNLSYTAFPPVEYPSLIASLKRFPKLKTIYHHSPDFK